MPSKIKYPSSFVWNADILPQTCWRSSYKERKVGVILSSLTPSHFLCLFQAKTWISNIIWSGVLVFRWEVVVRYVDLVGIFYPHCLNFLFNISGRFLVTVTVEIGIILLELLIITVRTFFSISLVGFWPPLQLRWVSFCWIVDYHCLRFLFIPHCRQYSL
jgi:hypothetical protein